jgi:hypothetical protein
MSTTANPERKSYEVYCPQCEALAINGVDTHARSIKEVRFLVNTRKV